LEATIRIRPLDNLFTVPMDSEGSEIPCDKFDNSILMLRVPMGCSDGMFRWSSISNAMGNKTGRSWQTFTGAIFEFGFPDALSQMWAAYLAERAGALGARFGTAAVREAVDAHKVFSAALALNTSNSAMPMDIVRER
jgi:hypothetical protein